MIGQTVSHYKILEKLGEGGMGVVYKAHDTRLDRVIALKFLPAHFTASDAESARFLQEAKAASAVNHPNVCVIYDIQQHDDPAGAGKRPFIAMEYVEGTTLRDHAKLSRDHSLPWKESADIVIQIADGLAAAHKKGIVHRDIKSENIMITKDGRVKIMDFGLARLRGNLRLTKTGSTLGTIAYMSPEQIQDMDIDERADIWSVGVVLFELLTGKLPFAGEHQAAMMYSILNLEPPPVTSLRADVPGSFEKLMSALLQKDRSLRVGACTEIIQALRKIQQGSEAAITVQPVEKRKSVAVLPFANVSPDPENEFFSDGITEELIASLSKVKQLRVCSRSMAFQYKAKLIDPRQVGRDLSVDVILEGSIRRIGNRVRIAAELTDTANGFQLWAESYDRQIDDVFAVQDEIARTIVEALQLQMSLSDQSTLVQKYKANVQAYEEYLRARYWWSKRTKESIEQGIHHLERAIQIDENYAIAYADLAICYHGLANYAWLDPETASRKAEEYAQKALLLEPNLDEAHVARACLFQVMCDFERGEFHFKRAIQLNPSNDFAHHCFAYIYLARGDFQNALRENSIAQRLEPLSPIINAYAGFIYFCMGQYEQALKEVQKSIEIDPAFAQGHHLKAWILIWCSRYDDALMTLHEAKGVWGEHNHLLGAEGVLRARTGNESGAREILEKLHERQRSGVYVHPCEYAYIHAALGESDAAFEMVEKASEIRFYWWFTLVKVHPAFESIRRDPRFPTLIEKLGLNM